MLSVTNFAHRVMSVSNFSSGIPPGEGAAKPIDTMDVPVAPASPKRLPRGDLKARMHRFNFPDSRTPDSPPPKITGGLRRLSGKHESPNIKKEPLDDDATHTVQPNKEISKRWSNIKKPKAPADGAKKLQMKKEKAQEEKAVAGLSRLTKVLQEETLKVEDAKKTKEAKEVAAAMIAKEKLDKQRKKKAEAKEKDDEGKAKELAEAYIAKEKLAEEICAAEFACDDTAKALAAAYIAKDKLAEEEEAEEQDEEGLTCAEAETRRKRRKETDEEAEEEEEEEEETEENETEPKKPMKKPASVKTGQQSPPREAHDEKAFIHEED